MGITVNDDCFFASAVRFCQRLDPDGQEDLRQANAKLLRDPDTHAFVIQSFLGLKQNLSEGCFEALLKSRKKGTSCYHPFYNLRARFVHSRFDLLIDGAFPSDVALMAIRSLASVGWIGGVTLPAYWLPKLLPYLKQSAHLIGNLSNLTLPHEQQRGPKKGQSPKFTPECLEKLVGLRNLWTEIDACEMIPNTVRRLYVSCGIESPRRQLANIKDWDLRCLDCLHVPGLDCRTFRWLLAHQKLGALQQLSRCMSSIEADTPDEPLTASDVWIESLLSPLFNATRLESLSLTLSGNNGDDCVARLLGAGKFLKLKHVSIEYRGYLSTLENVDVTKVPALECCHLVDDNLDPVAFPKKAKWNRYPSGE